MQGVTLLKVMIEAYAKIVTSEHRPEGNEGIPPMKISVKDDLHRRNIQCKVPEDEWSLECSIRSKHAYVCRVVSLPSVSSLFVSSPTKSTNTVFSYLTSIPSILKVTLFYMNTLS